MWLDAGMSYHHKRAQSLSIFEQFRVANEPIEATPWWLHECAVNSEIFSHCGSPGIPNEPNSIEIIWLWANLKSKWIECHHFCIRPSDINTWLFELFHIFHVNRGFAQINRFICVNTSLSKPMVSFPPNNLPYPLFFNHFFRLLSVWRQKNAPDWYLVSILARYKFITCGTQLMSAQFNKLQPFPYS